MTISQTMWKKLAVLAIAGGALSVSACSTTSNVKVAQGAPITYKVGEGAVQYASVNTTLPRSSNLPSGKPTVTIPSPYTTPQPARPQTHTPSAKSRPQVDKFDAKRVDKDLYKHQKVGKKYSVLGKKYTPKHDPKYDKKGLASWYGDKYHGKPTATGEIFDKNAMTAAHKTLPLNSMLHVTNLETGESILLRLNDRGPFVKGRIVDLSEAAARRLGVIDQGTARVRVRYAGPADPMAASRMVEAPQPMPYQPEAPQPAPVPQSVALPVPAAPAQPSQDGYKPLRDYTPHEYDPIAPARPAPRTAEDMGTPYAAPQYQQPQYQQPEYQPPRYEPSVPQQMTPQAPTALPEDPAMGGEDDVITLTIKGPIHMAKHSAKKEAQWVPAYNVTMTSK